MPKTSSQPSTRTSCWGRFLATAPPVPRGWRRSPWQSCEHCGRGSSGRSPPIGRTAGTPTGTPECTRGGGTRATTGRSASTGCWRSQPPPRSCEARSSGIGRSTSSTGLSPHIQGSHRRRAPMRACRAARCSAPLRSSKWGTGCSPQGSSRRLRVRRTQDLATCRPRDRHRCMRSTRRSGGWRSRHPPTTRR